MTARVPPRQAIGWALVVALGLLLAWDFAGLDQVTTRWWADGHGFSARHAFWSEGVLHSGVRALIWAAVALNLALIVRPLQAGPSRWELVAGVVAALLVSSLVNTLKAHSLTSCPWELAAFGGEADWVSHWAWGRGDGGTGHCFPSGHAGGAFALWGLCWPWWRHQRRAALWAFAAVTVVGSAASLGQWARGAHHLSHSLWAAWLCAAGLWLLAGCAALWLARQEDQPPGRSEPGAPVLR